MPVLPQMAMPMAMPMVAAGTYRSLSPREPDPFSVVPPALSLPPR
jgi:hypothetical protein